MRYSYVNLVALALLVSGCAAEDIETAYGHRGGLEGGQSVNGTAVLSDLFSAAGHRVETRHALSPSVQGADTIVWVPDCFQAPSDLVCEWLEEWLADGGDRTLIYVGRDFDAAPLYWRKVQPLVSAADKPVVDRRLAAARRLYAAERDGAKDPLDCGWFTIEMQRRPREVRDLSGKWSTGVDAAKVEIALEGRLVPQTWAESLLESGDDVLVSRLAFEIWDGGKIIMVANGSFLLNLPLVNHEHRKLAGHLVDEVGPPGRVVFLESGAEGPTIQDHDPVPTMSTGLEILRVWPINAVLLHLAVLGIIFCFARFPIFGTPRQLAVETVSDFGRHVDALGELLERTGDREFALSAITRYRDGRTGVGGRRSEVRDQRSKGQQE